ncbi:MAG TPA: hypothetical protein VKB23_12515 [Solirubrobacterales bacterium]|nr:hypothetical protein [Solirubrobacterales bacterium]
MKRLGILALLALALLALPVSAAAGQSRVHDRAEPPPLRLLPPIPRGQLLTQHGKKVAPRPFFRSGFVLEADGYRVGVSTFGSAVFVEVWRGRQGHRTMTAYFARGVARPERLQATFGQFGKVKMRFRESRNRTWAGKRRTCRGANRFIKRRGVFRGNLRFEGEGGYVSVRIHRAKGAVVTTAPKCLRRRGPGSAPDFGRFLDEPKGALMAIARSGVDSTSLLAVESRRSTLFTATAEETHPRLAIIRIAALRKHSPIRANESLSAASVSPPAPFRGTGRYNAQPDGSSTWSGNLNVNFPGAPHFPLTGPSFETFLEIPF